MPWLDTILFVCQMSLGFFLMCSVYLPMVPYIIFMGQVLEWVASVMLGVAAAPFLAFAHFDTDGEGLGQRTQYGYTFMLQSFMRPILLILGFILSSAMIEVSVYYLTASFSFALADAQIHSVTGIFSMLGFIALYMTLAVGMVNTSCSLMYLIPDAIFRFMGADTVGMGFGRETGQHAQGAALAGAGASRSMGNKSAKSKGAKDSEKAQGTHDGQQREMEADNYQKWKATQSGGAKKQN